MCHSPLGLPPHTSNSSALIKEDETVSAIEEVKADIDRVLAANYQHLTVDDRNKGRGWAIEAGARYIASHPNGPLPLGSNLVQQQWKKLHM